MRRRDLITLLGGVAAAWPPPSEGKFDRLPALARELVDLKVAAIAAMGGDYSTRAAKSATSTIPIVFNTGHGENTTCGQQF